MVHGDTLQFGLEPRGSRRTGHDIHVANLIALDEAALVLGEWVVVGVRGARIIASVRLVLVCTAVGQSIALILIFLGSGMARVWNERFVVSVGVTVGVTCAG